MVTIEPAVASAPLLDLNYILETCLAFSTKILFCRVFLKRLFSHPASRAFLCLLECGGEEEALPESHQTSAVATAQLVLSHKTGFFVCEHPFFDKPMVLTEPAEATCRGCSTKTLLDSCSLSLVRQNWASERKALQDELKQANLADTAYLRKRSGNI